MGRVRTGRLARGFLALAGVVLMASGCAAGEASGPTPPSAAPSSEALTVPAPAGASEPGAATPPSEATMVCGEEIRGRIAQILALPSVPAPSSSWAGGLYTCSYRLPGGLLVLSVKESEDPAAARAYATAAEGRLPGAVPIEGLAALGLPAYGSPAGAVVFAKDSFTLTVDATGLGGTVGPQGISRSSFAYQIATDVLACWSG